MGKKKHLKRIKKVLSYIKGSTTVGTILLLGLVVLIILILSNGFYNQLSKNTTDSSTAVSYCCDNNDCSSDPRKNISYTNDSTYRTDGNAGKTFTYGLIKSEIRFAGDGHIAHLQYIPNSKTPDGYPIYHVITNYNDKNEYANSHGCVKGNDYYLSGYENPGLDEQAQSANCYGTAHEQLIFVCKAPDCKDAVSRGDTDYLITKRNVNGVNYDVYLRQDGTPVPDFIKSCVAPTNVVSGTPGAQTIVTTTPYVSHASLQLETFRVQTSEPKGDWTLTPWCKPAIYLYPTEKTNVHVQVKPVGRMTLTIPSYPASGWNVTSYPNGNIVSGNASFDYLYYEAQIPDTAFSAPTRGYVIEGTKLGAFLPELVTKLGLNEKEQAQFTSYWLKALPSANYYFLGVMPESKLDSLAPLTISPAPDVTLRVTLYFQPLDKKITVLPPDIHPTARNGFTVVEWGGLYKRDKEHNFTCDM